MNLIVGAVLGFAIATASVIGGVSAYTSASQPVESAELYVYADQ